MPENLNQFERLLIGRPPKFRDWVIKTSPQQEERTFYSVFLAMGILDICLEAFPRVGQSACSMLSLLATRGPVSVLLAQLDIEASCYIFAHVLQYFQATFLEDSRIVKERYAINAMMQALPILFYFAGWHVAHEFMVSEEVVSMLVSTIYNVLKHATGEENDDVPPDYVFNPKHFELVNHIQHLFADPEFVTDHHMTACVLACVEILYKLTTHGVSVWGFRVLLDKERMSVATVFSRYLKEMDKICERTPKARHGRTLIEILAHGNGGEKARKAAQ